MKSARFDPKSDLSRSMRKQSASFYTRVESAILLATLTITDFHQKICDPACGTGILLEAAFQRKKQLFKRDHENNKGKDVSLLLEDLYGVEILPDAANAAQKRLENLDLLPSQRKIDSINIQIFTDDATSHVFPPSNTVLLNPPFIKKQLLKTNNRQQLKENLNKYYQQKLLNSRSSMTSHFLCLADSILHQNELPAIIENPKSLGAVLPASFLCSFEDFGLRQYILEHYWIKAIIFREDRANFSEDTELQEILLILTESTSQERQITTYIFISELSEKNTLEIGEFISSFLENSQNSISINKYTSLSEKKSNCNFLRIYQDRLDPQNLFYYAALGAENLEINLIWMQLRQNFCFIPLKRLVNVKIESKNAAEPQYTGLSFKNTAFLKPDYAKDSKDLLILDTSSSSIEVGMKSSVSVSIDPSKKFVRMIIEKKDCLLGFRYVTKKKTMDISQLEEYILVSPSSSGYLSHISLASWKIWQKYTQKRQTKLILTDRTNLIRPGVHHLAFYSNNPRIIARSAAAISGIENDQGQWCTLWFNSSWGLLEWIIQRVPQQFTYCQHHKHTLERLMILDYSKFNLDDRLQVEKFYYQICNIPFPSIFDQYLQILSKKSIQRLELRPILSQLPLSIGQGFIPRIDLDIFIGKLLVKYSSTETWTSIYQQLGLERNYYESLVEYIQLAITRILINAYLTSKLN